MSKYKSLMEINPIYTFEKGESIECVYKGTRKVEKIQSLLHTIEFDGIEYDVYGCGGLDHQLKMVEPEMEIKILYSGKKSANIEINGVKMKKDIHQYTVMLKQAE